MIAMKSVRLATVVFAGTLVMAGSAFAETSWERNHPRRDQVNDRLENQSRRINREYREGEITRGQARALHRARTARCAARSAPWRRWTAATSLAPTSAFSIGRRMRSTARSAADATRLCR